MTKKKITKQDILNLEYEEKKAQVNILKGLEAISGLAMTLMVEEINSPEPKKKKKKKKSKKKKK